MVEVISIIVMATAVILGMGILSVRADRQSRKANKNVKSFEKAVSEKRVRNAEDYAAAGYSDVQQDSSNPNQPHVGGKELAATGGPTR